MSTPDEQWWAAQAGEYVLGTLDESDRLTVQKAIVYDKDAALLVAEWEQALQPLADSLKPVNPSSAVWNNIQQQLSHSTPNAHLRATHSNEFDDTEDQSDNTVVDYLRNEVKIEETQADLKKANIRNANLESTVDRWRGFAGLATAASLLIAMWGWTNYTNVRDQQPPATVEVASQYNAISIIRNDQSLPLWVVDTALDDGLVRVTAIAPPSIETSQSYELWLVKPDDGGVQSLGLLPATVNQSLLLTVQAEINNPVAFAVSLEPAGGSQLDVPSGPVLYQGAVQSLEL